MTVLHNFPSPARLAWLAGLCFSFSVLACATACDSDSAAACLPGPALLVGGADFHGNGFVDWQQGPATAQIIRGPQGGQHVWLSVRVPGTQAGLRTARVALRETASGKALDWGVTQLTIWLKPNSLQMLEYDGMPVFVARPCEVHGQRCTATVELQDPSGCVTLGSIDVTPVWDGECP